MERIYSSFFNQLIRGRYIYSTRKIEDFILNKDEVRHGRNGICALISGSTYRIGVEPKKINQDDIGFQLTTSDYNMFIQMELIDISHGNIGEFPFLKNLDVRLHPRFYTNPKFELETHNGEVIPTIFNVRTLLLLYSQKQDSTILFNASYNLPKKRKKLKDKIECLLPNLDPSPIPVKI